MSAPHAVTEVAGSQVRRNESAIQETERIMHGPIRGLLQDRYKDASAMLRMSGLRCSRCAGYTTGWRFEKTGCSPSVLCRECSDVLPTRS